MRAFARPAAALALLLALAACDTAAERAESHYQRALTLIAAGDRDRAVVELRNVFQLNPGHVPARLRYAELLRDRGATGEAIGQYLRLTELDPKNLAGQRELAELALEVQDLDTAAEHVAAAWALAPADPTVRALKASVDFRRPESRAAAVAMATGVVAEDPKQVAAQMVLIADRVAAREPRAALARIDAALGASPADQGLHLARLSTLEALGDDAGTGAELKRMADFPDNPGVRDALVQWHLHAGDPAAAEAVLRAAAARAPDAPAAALAVVQFLLAQQGPDAARAELDRDIAAAKDPAPFRRARAGLDFAQGDHDAAIAAMRALLAGAAPSDATRDLQVGLAEMLAETGQDQAATELLTGVLAADANQVAALKLRAKMEIDADRPDDAIQDLRKAATQAPNDPEIMTVTALAHERAGSRELAGEQLARAVEASGQGAAESLRYAQFLMQDDRTDVAESVVVAGLRRAPDDPDLLETLGRIHIARRDWPRVDQVAGLLRAGTDPAARARADALAAASLKAQGRTADSVALLESMAGAGDDGVAMAAAVRAEVEAGDLAGAEGYLDGLLAKDPKNPAARLLAAGLAAVQGDPARAEAGYKALIADAPGLLPAYQAYATFLAGAGRRAEADAALGQGLAVAPDDSRLIFARAGLREAAGDLEGALGLYETLYARDSGSEVLANNVASLLTATRSDPASLERAYQVARRLRGAAVPQFQDTYGWILQLRGDPGQALDYLKPAAAALPGNAEVLFHRGEAEFALGQREAARASFTAALAAADAGSPLPQADAARARLAALAAPLPAAAAPDPAAATGGG